jgi:hypothetical protein
MTFVDSILVLVKTLNVKGTKMNRKVVKVNKHVVEIPEQSPWDSGFSIFKRRIGELMQLSGNDDSVIDDDDLIPYYRMGESETFVLSALGCTGY